MKITVFSTGGCPYCILLKDYLNSKKISFIEKMVDQDEEAKKQMLKDSKGFLGVPFTVVLKDDGTKDTIIGFDKGKIDKVLELSQEK